MITYKTMCMEGALRRTAIVIIFLISHFSFLISSCTEPQEHTARAVNPEDSASIMVSYGVNTLIRDRKSVV